MYLENAVKRQEIIHFIKENNLSKDISTKELHHLTVHGHGQSERWLKNAHYSVRLITNDHEPRFTQNEAMKFDH